MLPVSPFLSIICLFVQEINENKNSTHKSLFLKQKVSEIQVRKKWVELNLPSQSLMPG
jgi:hypothetical protein